MKTVQVAVRDRYYECEECRHGVNPASYRAACPRCGGSLRVVVE